VIEIVHLNIVRHCKIYLAQDVESMFSVWEANP